MTNSIQSIAIIAGRGDLPKLTIEKCQKDNIKFQLFLISSEEYDHDYSQYQPYVLKYGEIAKFLEICQEHQIANIIMVGGVTKPDFKSITVDKKSAILLTKILAKKILGDDAVLKTVVSFFEKEGFKIIKVNDLLEDILAQKGNLTVSVPDSSDNNNIKIAKNAIEALSQFDIGQSLIVAQQQIIAVEAAEGTDNMINRIGTLDVDYKNSAILVKLSKKNQSKKVDLPTIGLQTIKNCIDNNISGIAIESGKTIIVDKEQVIALANDNKIFITAI